MTRTPKWRRLSFGCGLLSREFVTALASARASGRPRRSPAAEHFLSAVAARRQSPGDRLDAPPPIAPHEAEHGSHAASREFTQAARLVCEGLVRAAGPAAERVRKPTRFFESRRTAPGEKKCSATRISTRLRGQRRGRLRPHTNPSRHRSVKSVSAVTARQASAINAAARSRSSSDTSSLGECM